MAAKTRDEYIDTIAASVDSLFRPMHVKRTVAGVTEAVTFPSLVDQINGSMGAARGSEDFNAPSYTAKAPVELHVLDVLVEIERTIDHWQNLLGVSWRLEIADRARGILGQATTLNDLALLKGIAYDFERMVTIASVATEWESEPFEPRATCPQCEARYTLRVQVLSRTAMCLQCRVHWTPETFGILVEYVRADNIARDGDAA